MRIRIAILAIALIFASCGKDQKNDQPTGPQSATTLDEQRNPPERPDPVAPQNVDQLKPGPNIPDEPVELKGVNLTTPLLPYMIRKGQKVYDAQCVSCHSLDGATGQASSFAGITKRRAPEWIMNMVTGVDLKIIVPDRRERGRLQGCFTRQEGQRLDIVQARDLLEMLRKNDGEE